MPSPQTILIFSANPRDTKTLRLGEELREIKEALKRAHLRDVFQIEQSEAVRPRDVQRALLEHRPAYVHFCGHGTEQGIVFENDNGDSKTVDGEALAGLFDLFADSVQCVLLNACYSESQAQAIVRHIPYVVGMNKPIGDRAAIQFAVGFYDALGAGKPVEFAYKLGCTAIRMDGGGEYETPVLLKGAAPARPATSPPGNPGLQQIREIVTALLACPSVSDAQTRATVLQQLPAPIQNAVTHHPRSDIHVTQIVRTCLNYPGGIAALLDAVGFFDGGTECESQLRGLLQRMGLVR